MWMRGIVAIMLVLVVGCSAPPAAPTAAPAKPTAAAAGAPSTAATAGAKLDFQGYKGPALTDQPTTLHVLRQSYGDAEEGFWKDMYAKWNAAYPNITIQEETVPFGQLFTKVQTSAASGDPPDVMMGQGDFTRNYDYNKIALPLNDYLTQAYIDDYFPVLKQMASVGDKLYLMPYELQVSTMVYNKDALKQAGVDEPPLTADSSAAWTWQQWRDTLLKIHTSPAGGAGDAMMWPLAASQYGPGGPGGNYWHEGILIRSYGDPAAAHDSSSYKTWAGISDDGLTATGYVDTPEAIDAMKMYQSLFADKLTPTGAMPNSWFDGKAAIDWAGGQTWAYIPQQNVKFAYAMTANPKGKVQFTHISGDAPFVSSKSKHSAEAVAFLTFIMNDTNRIAWDAARGPIPARKAVMDKLPKFKEYPYTMMMDEVTRFGAAAPQTPGALEYQIAMNTAIKDIALGADPAARLHQVAGEIDGALSKYK